MKTTLDWDALAAIAHRDPGHRGLASYRAAGEALDRGQLAAAAADLATRGRRAALVTGFCAVLADRVTAETDGPPGALFLAQIFQELGIEVVLVGDRHVLPLLERGCALLGIEREAVVEFPCADDRGGASRVERWIDDFHKEQRDCLSHLIAIERPGPSHTSESLAAQRRDTEPPVAQFLDAVPAEHRDRCHTMRGVDIDQHTPPVHRLFEAVAERRLPIATIGIGDGGNEIGMGTFAWETLAAAVASPAGARIACRVATDFSLVAGTSNWGAYALGLAVAALRGHRPQSRWLSPDGQRELVEQLVAAGAVDGRTLEALPTVDGLAADAYLAPLSDMWAWLGSQP